MEPKHPLPTACTGCPAHGWAVGFVPPAGPDTASYAFVGQGPGEQEARFGVPFFPKAPSGGMLTRRLARAGLARENAWIWNVVQCWLPALAPAARPKVPVSKWGNREPTRDEVRFCWRAHLGPRLRAMAQRKQGALKVFTVGAPATKWLLGLPWNKGSERWVGTPNRVQLPEVED